MDYLHSHMHMMFLFITYADKSNNCRYNRRAFFLTAFLFSASKAQWEEAY